MTTLVTRTLVIRTLQYAIRVSETSEPQRSNEFNKIYSYITDVKLRESQRTAGGLHAPSSIK